MANNHTANYGLCQWEETDKVLRTEFNGDNAKIDAALAGLERDKAEASAVSALQAAVAKKAEQSALTALQTTVNSKASQSALNALQTFMAGKGNCRIELGSYVGTGVSPASIKTSFPPKVVIIMQSRVGIGVRGYERIQFLDDYVRSGHVTWKDDGLSWTPGPVANDGQWNNAKDTVYYYAVFG